MRSGGAAGIGNDTVKGMALDVGAETGGAEMWPGQPRLPGQAAQHSCGPVRTLSSQGVSSMHRAVQGPTALFGKEPQR